MPRSVLRIVFVLLPLLAMGGGATHAQRRVNYAEWQLEWAEEFNRPTDTTALMARWRFDFPWGRNLVNNLETEYYSGVGVRPDSGGALHLVATLLPKPIAYQGKQLRYSSGMLMSHHPVDPLRPPTCPQMADGFSYGLFEVRARQPARGSVFPAFWLWGGGPDEIDVFEAERGAFGNTIHTNSPGYWYPTRTQPDACSCYFFNTDPRGDLHDQFHTYGVEWMPNEVVFYFDGYPIRRETRLLPNGCAMYIIVNLAMWNWANSAADTLHVDYVRVYRPRVAPTQVAVVRYGGQQPGSEYEWTPFEFKPGRLDVGRVQQWRATPRSGGRLDLQLIDNLNAVCESKLPLPLDGRWAPPWLVFGALPDVRMQFVSPDSVVWQLADVWGRTVAAGVAPGRAEWLPRWPDLPAGHYALHLRQGVARATQAVVVVARSQLDILPQPAWLQPAPNPLISSDSVSTP
jgi:hypothetical protein